MRLIPRLEHSINGGYLQPGRLGYFGPWQVLQFNHGKNGLVTPQSYAIAANSGRLRIASSFGMYRMR